MFEVRQQGLAPIFETVEANRIRSSRLNSYTPRLGFPTQKGFDILPFGLARSL